MQTYREIALIEGHSFECDVDVLYEVYPPELGAPEQVEIISVHATGPTGQKVFLLPLLSESEIIEMEDLILANRKDVNDIR